MTTFLAIAANSKLEFSSFVCSSKGKLEQVEGKFLMTAVILEPTLTLIHPSDLEKAERVLQKSETACLITNSVKAAVSMIPNIIFATLPTTPLPETKEVHN